MSHHVFNALILAAGKGTRMNSMRPKLLQPLAGRPMLSLLLDTLKQLNIHSSAVIYGYLGEQLQAEISSDYPHLHWFEQKEQLGTAHAVIQALPFLQSEAITLILLGDCPLLTVNTLNALLTQAEKTGAALLTANFADPSGYGRIVRDVQDNVVAIVEHKDATDEQCKIQEINTGVMAINNALLREYLPQIDNKNAQKEYYLTDLIALLSDNGWQVSALLAENEEETLGINNRAQLAQAEAVYRKRQAQQLLAVGVTLIDPARIDVHGQISVGHDVLIEPNVFFKGKVVLGNHVHIGAGSVLIDCELGDNVRVQPMSMIEKSQIAADAEIGPYARIRPNTQLKRAAKIGNFVEIKASIVDEGSKVNHLSYIGDAIIGKNVNIGAGTITCNYDGVNKYRTEIGNQVFVGSNTALVAPLRLGDRVTIGAGSVITQNISADSLAFTRADLQEKPDWLSPIKKKTNQNKS